MTAAGALYFSSAGNEGNLDSGTSGVWEGDFLDGGMTSLESGRIHNFGPANFTVLSATGFVNNLY